MQTTTNYNKTKTQFIYFLNASLITKAALKRWPNANTNEWMQTVMVKGQL